MRTGIINDIDLALGVGSILDENEQEIPFHFKHLDECFKKGAAVTFEIELDTNGLVAKDLKAINRAKLQP